MNFISSVCHIQNNRIFIDGELKFEGTPDAAFTDFALPAFRNLGITYPKFFKMDNLCKLALLASEYLLRSDPAFEAAGPENTGIVLANRASSLESDRIHAASILHKESYFPSPAVFVYTLPNIMIGEIGIRYKITGENACFVSSAFDAELIVPYVNQLLYEQRVKACLTGWVELDGPSYEAFLYLVVNSAGTRKNSNFSEHSIDNINQLRTSSPWILSLKK